MKFYVTLTALFVLSLCGCRKRHLNNPCQNQTLPVAQFTFKEVIGDTAFVADTIFRNHYVQFQALDNYQSVLWKLGSDPRDFTSNDFSLSFSTTLGTLPIVFTGKKTPNTACFPNDNGTYTATRPLTVLEGLQKPILTLSPLIGKYKGAFSDNISDSFNVRIEYFDSTKYDVMLTGSQNFYWVSNFPQGYVGTETAASAYPELANGRSLNIGYKCFEFGARTEVPLGWSRGWLSHDTLFISCGSDVIARRKFIGKRL